MNENTISPDDPRLTLYALHEMEPAERVGFEKLLAQDPAARQVVAEIQALATTVSSALEEEPAFAEPTSGKPTAAQPGKVLRFPQIYYMVSGLAAACFAVFFVYWQQNRPVYEKKQYMAVDLAQASEADAAKEKAEGSVTMNLPVAPAPSPSAMAPTVTMGLLESTKTDELSARAANSGSGYDNKVAAVQLAQPEETVALSPFTVEAKRQNDYISSNSMGGSRVRTELKDSGSSITVVTNQFMAESAAVNQNVPLNYTASAKVGRMAGNIETQTWSTRQQTTVERESNNEAYAFKKDNDYLRVTDNPLSTFSIDVDTASYANVRRFLNQGRLPPADAVRIEELINYFPYHYAPPTDNTPFASSLEVASAPWAPEHRLVRIGLKGREVTDAQRPAANLVFLLDVSGSMNSPNKLPLVKQSLRLLVNKLRPDDRVAIAVYAGASGLALPSTSAAKKAEILEAIDRLQATGSTNGAMGIHLAYDIAKANFVPGGVNRVILATDGDFNVGTTSEGELVRLIEEKAKSGVFLSVLGFGMGNLKDNMLEQIADKGNGNYAYIDSLAEAKKSLVEQAGGTLVTIAKDVKIQVEFNPAQVQAYRLIGYENRLLAKEDFNDDKVDAGEIGAGHTVTALYEVVPTGVDMEATAGVDPLKYQMTGNRVPRESTFPSKVQDPKAGELLTVKVRYKEPTGDVSRKLEFPLQDKGTSFEDASPDFKFAASVAAFGMILRDSPHKASLSLADVSRWATVGTGQDAGGYRSEFLGLVGKAESLMQ